MTDDWYLLAFGVELGPMSWEDLVARASKGDLRPDSLLRQGQWGVFTAAGDVPGLFAANEKQPNEAWYCELLGAELGPMPWDELRLLAERGTLRGDARVRLNDGDWVAASSVSGLMSAEDFEFDCAADVTRQRVSGARASEDGLPRPSSQEKDGLERPSSIVPAPQMEATESVAVIAPKAAATKYAEKPARQPRPRPQINIQVPWKLLRALAAAALLAAIGYGGWMLLPWRSTSPDYRQVATVYRQVYDQIRESRKDPRSRPPVGVKFQFSRRVAALRKQLQQVSGDAAAEKLAEAGSQLSQLLADCQAAPASPEASRFADTEQRFLALLDSVPTQQTR